MQRKPLVDREFRARTLPLVIFVSKFLIGGNTNAWPTDRIRACSFPIGPENKREFLIGQSLVDCCISCPQFFPLLQ